MGFELSSTTAPSAPSDEDGAEDVETDADDEDERPRDDGLPPPPPTHGQSVPATPSRATQLNRCANHIVHDTKTLPDREAFPTSDAPT